MTANFVLDEKISHSLSMSGVATIKGKATSLRASAKFVADQIRELDGVHDKATLINKALLATKVVKATADAFIDLASTMTGKAGSAVSNIYSASSSIASGASKVANGQGGAADLTKGALGAMMVKISPQEQKLWQECMAEFSKNTSSTLIDALNNDPASALTNMRNMGASCGAVATEAGIKMLFKDSKMGELLGKSMGNGIKVVNSLYTYNNELGKSIDEYFEEEDNISDLKSRKYALQRKLKSIEAQLRQLDRVIDECNAKIGEANMSMIPAFASSTQPSGPKMSRMPTQSLP